MRVPGILVVLGVAGSLIVRGEEQPPPRPRRYDQRIRLHRQPFEREEEPPDYVETEEQRAPLNIRATTPPPRERELPPVPEEDQRNWLLNSILAAMQRTDEDSDRRPGERGMEAGTPEAALMALRQWGWLSEFVLQTQTWEQEQEARARDEEARARDEEAREEEEEQETAAITGTEPALESLILAQPFEWRRVEGQETQPETGNATAATQTRDAWRTFEEEDPPPLQLGAGPGMPSPQRAERDEPVYFERTRMLLETGAPGRDLEIPDRFAGLRETEHMETAGPLFPPAAESTPWRSPTQELPGARDPGGYTAPSYTPPEVRPVAPAGQVTAPYRDPFSEAARDSAPFGER